MRAEEAVMAQTYSAFVAGVRVAAGPLDQIAGALAGRGLPLTSALVFDDVTGEPVRLNCRADLERALAAPAAEAGPPVDLAVRVLPRHRAWLERQQGGPSAAIRRLVEAARRDPARRAGQARQAAYRFISMLAGDFAGYEEACRALFAGDFDGFRAAAVSWPEDIREHGLRLAEAV
jgi:hypothetical protein